MKKILVIFILSLIFCNNSYALDAKQAKKACLDKGYEVGTEDFTDCALNLVLKDGEKKRKKENIFGSKTIFGSTKDCSHLKGKKFHKYLACKSGSSRYDDEVSLQVEEEKEKGETFNEKYDSLVDIFKKKK